MCTHRRPTVLKRLKPDCMKILSAQCQMKNIPSIHRTYVLRKATYACVRTASRAMYVCPMLGWLVESAMVRKCRCVGLPITLDCMPIYSFTRFVLYIQLNDNCRDTQLENSMTARILSAVVFAGCGLINSLLIPPITKRCWEIEKNNVIENKCFGRIETKNGKEEHTTVSSHLLSIVYICFGCFFTLTK